MNDAFYTQVTLNSTANIFRTHSMYIGWTNTLHIYSYQGPSILHTLGNDLFIARLQNSDGTDVEILQSIYISNEHY